MSASLVGSEMCIRDSCPGWSPGPRPSAPHMLRGACLAHAWPWGRTLPVSYTHLTLPTICSV
eukprot:10554604-Alexandrium_andersonii.AAC.1